ncbi:MAG TPA: PepSY-associated TM helix domain-containing protein [Trinickia sp.]|uniref:PepSY-associated TM helix domain-containing protein n=1 Tax=Trinickia sp. TaxID=2571163 RepID=UPI002C25CBE2|nr:PepSY-associated TM helix domain-containing protein [Trinickia sp.]HTI17865.1 PepSY-associated TM helix domain-containing protein [Trinickia sp.]
MRRTFVFLHRWFGLGTALFLFVSGLTGAVIAWEPELDRALNPAFFRSASPGQPEAPLALARRLETADPRLVVTYLPLRIEPGATLVVRVAGRTNEETGKPYRLGFDQVAIDPVTGAIQGRRDLGRFSLARLNLLPTLYELHNSLWLRPQQGGVKIGRWVLGIVGMIWLLDCCIGLVLAFPSAKNRWKSFVFRFNRGRHALTFDLHRSGGVWLWAVLATVALTSISVSLGAPVVRPLVSWLSPLQSTPFMAGAKRRSAEPAETVWSREQIVDAATAQARREGIVAPLGALRYAPRQAAYAIGFFAAGDERGQGSLRSAWLYWDAGTGMPAGQQIPGRGSAGDLFMQMQFPLHTGRIAGTLGRVVISVTGVALAMLSATGVLIWLKKRRARLQAARRSLTDLRPSSAR